MHNPAAQILYCKYSILNRLCAKKLQDRLFSFAGPVSIIFQTRATNALLGTEFIVPKININSVAIAVFV